MRVTTTGQLYPCLGGGERVDLRAALRSGDDAALDEAKDWQWYRHELLHGQIGRRFNLPTEINADDIEATFRNGELTLVLPKAEEVKPRSIEVKAVK